jgi:hypothetical protein
MPRNREVVGFLLATVLSSAACAGGESAWTGTVTDSAGIAIVQNPEAGMWPADGGPTITEELTIGSAEGDPDYQFAQIAAIDVASDGTIYAADMQGKNAKAFDATGKYLRTLGGGGSGPGEMGMPIGLLVTAGDTVLVPDIMLQRVNRYGPDGAPAGEVATPMAAGVSVRWAERPDGMLVQESRIMQLPGMEAVEPKLQLLRRTAGGELVDTMLTLPIKQSFEFSTEGGQLKASIRLFAPEPVWTLADDGRVLYAINTEYGISVYSQEGQLERIVRRAWTRKPVTEGDKQAFLKLLREMWGQAGVPAEAMDMLVQSVSFAEFYPAFSNLIGGPEGTLWVQRVRTAADVGEGVEFNPQDMGSPQFDVFDRNGRYLGVVTLPDRFNPSRIIGDRIYGIWRDELDVQYVKVLKITLPPE